MKHRFQGFPQSQFRLLLIPFALTILAGCQALSGLMPEPQKDSRQIDQIQKAVPPTWSIATPQPLSNAAPISQNQLATWFATFNDPLLDRMIKNAQLNSPTVAAAVARIDQARAQTRAANAGGALQVNGSAALNRSGGPTVPANTVLSFGADAGWEIDFWGAVSRSKPLLTRNCFRLRRSYMTRNSSCRHPSQPSTLDSKHVSSSWACNKLICNPKQKHWN